MNEKLSRYFKIILLVMIIGVLFTLLCLSKKVVNIVNAPDIVLESDVETEKPPFVFVEEDSESDWGFVKEIRKPDNISDLQKNLFGVNYDKYLSVIEEIEYNYEVITALIPKTEDERDLVGETFNLGNYDKLDLKSLKERYTAFSIKDGLVVIGYIGDTTVIYAYGLGYLEDVSELLVIDYSGIKLNKGLEESFEIGKMYPLMVSSTNRTVVKDINDFVVMFYKG